jgi:hypothetical protein
MHLSSRQHLVPKTDTAIDLIVDVIAGKELMIVEPTPDAPALKGVMEPRANALSAWL